jgi:hypothetical protein
MTKHSTIFFLFVAIYCCSMKIYDEIVDCNLDVHPLLIELVKNVFIGSFTMLFFLSNYYSKLYILLILTIFYCLDYCKNKIFFSIDRDSKHNFDNYFWHGFSLYIIILFFAFFYKNKNDNYELSPIKNIIFIIYVFVTIIAIFIDNKYFDMEFNSVKILLRLIACFLCIIIEFITIYFDNYFYYAIPVTFFGIFIYFITWVFMKCMFHNEPGVELEDIERVKEMFMTPCL